MTIFVEEFAPCEVMCCECEGCLFFAERLKSETQDKDNQVADATAVRSYRRMNDLRVIWDETPEGIVPLPDILASFIVGIPDGWLDVWRGIGKELLDEWDKISGTEWDKSSATPVKAMWNSLSILRERRLGNSPKIRIIANRVSHSVSRGIAASRLADADDVEGQACGVLLGYMAITDDAGIRALLAVPDKRRMLQFVSAGFELQHIPALIANDVDVELARSL
jgi:hypothetical protein